MHWITLDENKAILNIKKNGYLLRVTCFKFQSSNLIPISSEFLEYLAMSHSFILIKDKTFA